MRSFKMTVKEFLNQLMDNKISLVDEDNFIEKVTNDYDLGKLKKLRLDIDFHISDEKLDTLEKNEEIKRNTNDEYYLSGLRDEPAEGTYIPRLSRLLRLKRNVEYKINQLENASESEGLQVQPDEVARDIKNDTLSGDDTYSESDISFALKVFWDNYKEAKTYKDIQRKIRNDNDCPEILKHEKAYKRMLHWFHKLEDKAGVKLK